MGDPVEKTIVLTYRGGITFGDMSTYQWLFRPLSWKRERRWRLRPMRAV
jgi:hypothetical protein